MPAATRSRMARGRPPRRRHWPDDASAIARRTSPVVTSTHASSTAPLGAGVRSWRLARSVTGIQVIPGTDRLRIECIREIRKEPNLVKPLAERGLVHLPPLLLLWHHRPI